MKNTIRLDHSVGGPEMLISGDMTAAELVVCRTYLETSLTWISDLVGESVKVTVIRANYSYLAG